MAASGSLFAGRPRTGSTKLGAQVDADGNEIEVLYHCQIYFFYLYAESINFCL